MADLTKRLEKAEKYLQRGKPDSALEEYLEILQEEPNNDVVSQQAADLCVQLGRGADAVRLLSAVFARQANINDAAKASITYKKLARITPPKPEQMLQYAVLIEKKDKKEAADAFHKSSEAFLAGGRKPEALTALKHLVGLEPTLENFQRAGDLAAELGDGPAAASSYFLAGELVRNSGQDASGYYERAYALDAHNNDAALALSRVLLARGDSARAITILQPIATPQAAPEFREAYGRALLAAGRPLDAEPYVWELYGKDSKQVDEVALMIGAMIDAEQYDKALAAALRLQEGEYKSNRRRDYVALIKDVTDKHMPGVEFLEYLVELFNQNNREHDYCATLLKLFQLYYAAGNYLKAANSLDRAAEVDPYEPGHQKRLDMLRGKIETGRWNAIAGRFQSVAKAEEKDTAATTDSEPTVLEDFMLQAEIFLQYSMRSKAVERLERINKLFPREEEKNEKLRNLYMNAGYVPKYDGMPAPPPAAKPAAAPAPAPAPSQAMANENSVDNIARVTEITRNIYRQGNVKSALFTCVNDVGRHWNASRCVAGLCTPGKPPSAALEYCAPGIKQSDVMAIVKTIGTLQAMVVSQGSVSLSNTDGINDPGVKYLASLGIKSALAVPLLDGEEHVGVLILEQCDMNREWRQTDVMVLKTIADQTEQAVENAKLRSLMKTLAVTDEKSGLLKRSSYLDVLLSEARRCIQQGSTATLMLMNFGKPGALVKEIGETAVENLMQSIGQTICSHIRQNDVAVHYDLTTIAVVLSDTNDKNAFFVVDKLRKVLTTAKIPGTERTVPITVGIAEGVMQSKFDPVDIVTEVINRAEAALELAKAEGGNKAQSLAPMLESAAVA